MTKPPPITVALARFEDLLALGLTAVINGDSSLELVASDVEHDRLAVVLRAHRPSVALIDLDALETLAVVRTLSQEHPQTHLVGLSSDPSAAACAQLLAFGASACLSRRTQARDVVSAIHLAARGLQLIPSAPPAAGGEVTVRSGLLTARESELLPMLAQRRSNAQIALELQIGVETVRSHARSIYRKLGVSSRRELAALEAPAVARQSEHLQRRRAHGAPRRHAVGAHSR
jgi:DNA-binding NarL/FixJ family response regulator